MVIINGANDEQRIDAAATLGLLGTSNSLAYRVHEIERHLHSGAKWLGGAAVPDAEVHVADIIGTGISAFTIDAGNNDWGSWTIILGSSDTPVVTGKTYFDPHLVTITAAENNAIYFVQFTRGATGAAGYAAGNYTEFVVDTTKAGGVITPVQTGRASAGSKLWARTLCPGQNTATISFYVGLHEYEG